MFVRGFAHTDRAVYENRDFQQPFVLFASNNERSIERVASAGSILDRRHKTVFRHGGDQSWRFKLPGF
jgi:hypothetical protein